MSIHVAVEHRTVYTYDRRVQMGPQTVRLRPAPHCRTPISAYSLTISPAKHFINWQQDPFGNYLARLVFPEKSTEFSVVVDLVADLTVINPFDFFIEEGFERFPFVYDAALARDLTPYLAPDEPGPLLTEWMRDVQLPPADTDGISVVGFLADLNRRLHGDIAYTIRMEPGVQTPEETLAKRLGSCRDSAWLLVQALRRLGLAARFASGYLVQLTADIAALDGPSGPSADFTDLHAWAEVFIPGAGWIGLDPTSGLFAGEGHIPLACTPDPSSAAPISGLIEPCQTTFEHANIVRRIREDPRVTLPYSTEQWERIDALGHAVDAMLDAGDVRLTMGGEPTFVSIDDMDGAQWNTAADGPEKRALAETLARRLTDRFASSALLHHGQGKWYPGEPLPRWQTTIVWRTDGVPLWRNPKLLAAPVLPGGEPGAAAADARALALGIAARLGIAAALCVPAYEDPLPRLLAEAGLPGGEPPALHLDPEDDRLRTAAARAALVAALDADTGEPVGWVIPLHWSSEGAGGWATTRWTLRRGRLFLLPGDSPLGLRLPLTALTWTPAPLAPERSPFDPRPPLPAAGADQAPEGADEGNAVESVGAVAAAPVVPVDRCPPTALGVELRHGVVHVFLPPLQELEHAVALLAVIERSVDALGRPVVIEGYLPPRDPRIRQIMVTPDPGVIEVNVHPAGSWPELVGITTGLYEDARVSRLGTEKFALDGSHTGTGGGNHITLGAATPADSPLLRRPDLLRSMVTYWQHHPSLSYLFSGRFIGPTSQSPRVDEGRHESLYELEIAFAELTRLGRDAPPWIVDRLLRHLLVDLTGNTHRAEFCIDKLFSPDSERGRLGLLELRGFEMPPHPQMALVQSLLVRALVARFWNEPYEGPLVRWGTELHDRFLLPFHVAADIADVVDDLQRHGVAFEHGWLAPFLEFRFPRLGATQVAGVGIELRAAIEPWNVLGEEVALTATARYVDSSVERLQVRVDGMSDGRHALTCNGEPVPLRATGTPGEMVGAVRYRAWQPPSALHPTIGVHAPLVFDLVDLWSARSLGGCTYHVVHPGGRSYDRFPVNANEAEARRVARFVAHGHTPGPVDVTELGLHSGTGLGMSPHGPGGEYPRTLDLRRVRRAEGPPRPR